MKSSYCWSQKSLIPVHVLLLRMQARVDYRSEVKSWKCDVCKEEYLAACHLVDSYVEAEMLSRSLKFSQSMTQHL